jgi:hypothetical protein
MKFNKKEIKSVTVLVPMVRCDFCKKEAVEESQQGWCNREWGEIKATTKCGCSNNWAICPDCIRVRLHEIHEFHNKK